MLSTLRFLCACLTYAFSSRFYHSYVITVNSFPVEGAHRAGVRERSPAVQGVSQLTCEEAYRFSCRGELPPGEGSGSPSVCLQLLTLSSCQTGRLAMEVAYASHRRAARQLWV